MVPVFGATRLPLRLLRLILHWCWIPLTSIWLNRVPPELGLPLCLHLLSRIFRVVGLHLFVAC
jgi:hypothetical protein